MHPKSTALVRLPLLPTETHTTERMVNGVSAADGGLSASVRETYSGASATMARALRRRLDVGAYRDSLSRRVAAGIPRVRIASIASPDPASSDQSLAFQLEASAFAQHSGGLILVPMPFDSSALTQLPPAGNRRTAVFDRTAGGQ